MSESAPCDDIWHVYVVRAGDGSLYTGIATDVERRLAEHTVGAPRGARYLRGRGPLAVQLAVAVGDRATAQRVEHRIKRLPRSRKERLLGIEPSAKALMAFVGEPLPTLSEA